ncbi:hypothetical protein D3C73_495860 [compost metagenome]
MRIGDQLQAEWADNQACRQITENRAKPYPLEQRRGDNACAQKRHDLYQFTCIRFCRHPLFPLLILLTRSRAVSAQALSSQFLFVLSKKIVTVRSQLAQITPGENSTVVSVVESNTHGIISGRNQISDRHHTLAGNRHLLARAMALNLGRGRENPQPLGGQRKTRSIVECHRQRPLVFGHAQFGGPAVVRNLGHIRSSNFTRSGLWISSIRRNPVRRAVLIKVPSALSV